MRKELTMSPDARPALLDAYCGGGAASWGYHLAGFRVVGVDIVAQPDYPFEFVQGDAIEFIKRRGHEFAVRAASPPCQRKSRLRHYNDTPEKIARYEAKFNDLIDATRDALIAVGGPYVIENVPNSGLVDPVTLCGRMFGLELYRHRWFESNLDLVAPMEPQPYHPYLCTRNGYLPTPERPFMSIHGGKHSKAWQRAAAKAMGAPWIGLGVDTKAGIVAICEAIPPAYTEYLGRQLREALRVAA
jgi:DNA (cytosine-5)-methyltransferase 1